MQQALIVRSISSLLAIAFISLLQTACFNSSFTPSLPVSAPITEGTSVVEISDGNIADGITPTELSVWIKDSAGYPAEGVLPTISTDANDIVLIPCNTTDANGLSRCKIYTTSAGRKSFIISSPFRTMTLDINFLAPKPLHGSFGVVTGSTIQKIPAGNKVISASGIIESSINQKDTAGRDRLHSSHLSTIVND